MQHQPRLAPEQPGRVDAQRQIAPDAFGGIFADETLGFLVVPEVLHCSLPYCDG